MSLEALLPLVGFGGLSLTLASWMCIAFIGKSASARLSWVGASGLYAALLALFVSLFQAASLDGSLGRMLLFGFLLVMFAAGFLVAVWRTAQALAGEGEVSTEEHVGH